MQRHVQYAMAPQCSFCSLLSHTHAMFCPDFRSWMVSFGLGVRKASSPLLGHSRCFELHPPSSGHTEQHVSFSCTLSQPRDLVLIRPLSPPAILHPQAAAMVMLVLTCVAIYEGQRA